MILKPMLMVSFSDNAHKGLPGVAGASRELDETQICGSKYELRAN